MEALIISDRSFSVGRLETVVVPATLSTVSPTVPSASTLRIVTEMSTVKRSAMHTNRANLGIRSSKRSSPGVASYGINHRDLLEAIRDSIAPVGELSYALALEVIDFQSAAACHPRSGFIPETNFSIPKSLIPTGCVDSRNCYTINWKQDNETVTSYDTLSGLYGRPVAARHWCSVSHCGRRRTSGDGSKRARVTDATKAEGGVRRCSVSTANCRTIGGWNASDSLQPCDHRTVSQPVVGCY
jgi:hypothetical protein